MIKVKSLLPRHTEPKQAGCQTDFVLPKVKHSSDSYMNWSQLGSFYHHMNQSSKSQENSDLVYSVTCNQSITNPFWRKPESKQKAWAIETKGFRFYNFEENTTKQIIFRYLHGCTLSKRDQKVLSREVMLPYFCRKSQEGDLQVEVPVTEKLFAPLRQIVDCIRLIYESKTNKENRKGLYKKVCLTAERIMAEKNYIEIRDDSHECEQILKIYLDKYVQQIEKEKLRTKYDDKNFLNRFYEEIHQRYQKLPFLEETEEVSPVTEEQALQNSQLLGVPDQSSGIKVKKKGTVTESFLQLRFYNNLRKEVEVLSANTEEIINNQMERLNRMP